MAEKPEKWDLETEVIVVGTGGAGLTAAILAHDTGAKVSVIERTNKVGGTTAVSGGGIWIPLNHHMEEKGYKDDREGVLKYCKTLVRDRSPNELVETFVNTGSEMLKYMEEHTPVKFEATKMPDYHMEVEGANTGRTLGPLLFNINDLGESAPNLRRSPLINASIPMTFADLEAWEAFTKPHQIPFDVISERMEAGLLGFGESLIAALYKGCLDRGIEPILNTRARELVMKAGEVIGLRAEKEGKDCYIRASKAVILASGGFEWSDELKAAYLPGEVTHPSSPPFNEGDGLKMAMAAGALLGNMSECWGWTAVQIQGEEYEGRILSRGILPEKALPHCILVNGRGKRFVNEAASYNTMFKPLWAIEANSGEYANLPAFYIMDEQYHEKYVFLTAMPKEPYPPWVIQGDTLEELAQKAGIDPEGLKETCERFSKFAVKGIDPDFQRGKSSFDHYWGDPEQPANPSLGTIEKSPFYAIRVHVGALGTKGGPRTNTKGQVMHVSGQPIQGLFAAGNVMAGVSGPIYWGGGGTIGPAMTFGYICGKNAASE